MNRNLLLVACALLLAAVTLPLGCNEGGKFETDVPSGPEIGRANSVLTYTSSATDPGGDSVAVRFDWGDGDTSAWSASLVNGAAAADSHSWSAAGSYLIRAQAKNAAEVRSDWSPPLAVDIVQVWARTYGGAADDEGYAVIQSTDGGYVVAGHTASSGAGVEDIYVLKTDRAGGQVWAKTFGESGYDVGNAVAPTTDGGYVVTGVSWSMFIAYSVRLIKLDASGNLVTGSSIGWDGADIGRSVQQTSDGGFIIAGETDSYGAGDRDVYLIKADANCRYVWHGVFGGIYTDVGRSIRQTGDGGYIILGDTDTDGDGVTDVFLIRTDAAGNQIWTRTFDGGGPDHGYSVQITSDGGFVLVGQTAGGGGGYVYLIKTDPEGNKIWAKTIGRGQSDVGRSLQLTADGGYIIAGATASAGTFDAYLLKTDANGDTLWTRTYGDSARDDVCHSVQQTADGGYIIAGSTESYGAGGKDVWLIKTDPNGNVE